MFCLLNNFVLFTNPKQLLKCVRQNSYLHLGSSTYITWQGVYLSVKLHAGRTNKWTNKMKSLTARRFYLAGDMTNLYLFTQGSFPPKAYNTLLTGISQGFGKCTKATMQNNYSCRMPPDDCFYLETWSRYHYNKKRQKFKTTLIWRSTVAER